MHLAIPQTQIGNGATLGILATEELDNGKSRVQLVLTFYSDGPDLREQIICQCEAELRIQIGDSHLHHFIGAGLRTTTASFFLTIDGTLRNQQGYLKAMGRRIGRAIKKARREHDAQLAIEAGDTEEWSALKSAKSPLH
jgi:hypothetical protein